MSKSLWGDELPSAQAPTQTKRIVSAVEQLGRVSKNNPMIAVYGAGPVGTKCGDCKHFLRHLYHDSMLYKCRERGLTHGPGTDHRVRWQTCAKYEEAHS